MIDQFEADKCLYVTLTDNLQLMITENRSNLRLPRQPPGNSDGTNPMKVGEKSKFLPCCGHLQLFPQDNAAFKNHFL